MRRTCEDNMVNHLVIEILTPRFSKKQMIWFRKMERDGFEIKWLDGYMLTAEKTDKIISWLTP